MTFQEKKDTVLQMVSLHPSTDWYQQCLKMHMTADELALVQGDKQFLQEVDACLFIEKEKLMANRRKSMELAAKKGNWQGLDKLLQEIDSKMFSVKKDIGQAGGEPGDEVHLFELPRNGREV